VKSIQRRLIFVIGVAYCLLWSIGGLAVYLVVRAGYVAEFDRVLKANAQALAAMTDQRAGRVESDYSEDLMPGFARARHPDYFQLWLPDGSTQTRSPSLADNDLPRRAGTINAPHFWDMQLLDGRPGRAVGIHFIPQVDDESPGSTNVLKGDVTLVVARHRGNLDERLGELASALLLVGGSMIVATVLIVVIAVRYGLQPLWELGERAEKIDASSLQLRFATEKMPAELLPIAERLNQLLARLEQSFTRERRFSADVAHELRTPIAELRTATEVALKWPEDVEATRNTLQELLAVALQMETIVTGLLALARCEAGQLPVHLEPVSLLPMIEEVFRPLADKAGARQILSSVHVAADACWLTDATLLRAILNNLVSNAVQYCTNGGTIRLSVEGDQLSISNATDDLTADDLPHLFERFWRKDAARSSNLHSGLGLALAKAYAAMLGLKLRAELDGTKQIVFVLSVARSGVSHFGSVQDAAPRFVR
jgi:two-component system, OmpR family, heavy metal sensor histidine kinase CusS